MVLDEYFYKLTGGIGVDGKEVILEIDPFATNAGDDDNVVFGLKYVTEPQGDGASDKKAPPVYDNKYHRDDYVIESDIIFPKITRAERRAEKPVVLVIDDDSQTLDLMKIYLMRDYEYHGFLSSKEGLIYLKDNIVDLILFDSSIGTVSSDQFVQVIRQFNHCKDVPIIYLGSEADIYMIRDKLPKGVSGTLKRPVARGDLHEVLNRFIKNE